jgi:hypothetical protein
MVQPIGDLYEGALTQSVNNVVITSRCRGEIDEEGRLCEWQNIKSVHTPAFTSLTPENKKFTKPYAVFPTKQKMKDFLHDDPQKPTLVLNCVRTGPATALLAPGWQRVNFTKDPPAVSETCTGRTVLYDDASSAFISSLYRMCPLTGAITFDLVSPSAGRVLSLKFTRREGLVTRIVEAAKNDYAYCETTMGNMQVANFNIQTSYSVGLPATNVSNWPTRKIDSYIFLDKGVPRERVQVSRYRDYFNRKNVADALAVSDARQKLSEQLDEMSLSDLDEDDVLPQATAAAMMAGSAIQGLGAGIGAYMQMKQQEKMFNKEWANKSKLQTDLQSSEHQNQMGLQQNNFANQKNMQQANFNHQSDMQQNSFLYKGMMVTPKTGAGFARNEARSALVADTSSAPNNPYGPRNSSALHGKADNGPRNSSALWGASPTQNLSSPGASTSWADQMDDLDKSSAV